MHELWSEKLMPVHTVKVEVWYAVWWIAYMIKICLSMFTYACCKAYLTWSGRGHNSAQNMNLCHLNTVISNEVVLSSENCRHVNLLWCSIFSHAVNYCRTLTSSTYPSRWMHYTFTFGKLLVHYEQTNLSVVLCRSVWYWFSWVHMSGAQSTGPTHEMCILL
jgi:hypothetical protein